MKRLDHKTPALMVTLILTLVLAAVTIPMALSYLTSSPDALENMFTDPYVPPDITETFDGEIKENIRIENTGNVDAYIRAALVIYAKAEKGDILAYSPVHGTRLHPVGTGQHLVQAERLLLLQASGTAGRLNRCDVQQNRSPEYPFENAGRGPLLPEHRRGVTEHPGSAPRGSRVRVAGDGRRRFRLGTGITMKEATT